VQTKESFSTLYSFSSNYDLVSPIFSSDGTTVVTTSNAQLITISDEDIFAYETPANNYMYYHDDLFTVTDSASRVFGTNEITFNKETLGKNHDVLYAMTPTNYFLFYNSVLTIDEEIYILPALTYTDDTDNIFTATFMEDGQLIQVAYPYESTYTLQYGDVVISPGKIGNIDALEQELIDSETLNNLKEAKQIEDLLKKESDAAAQAKAEAAQAAAEASNSSSGNSAAGGSGSSGAAAETEPPVPPAPKPKPEKPVITYTLPEIEEVVILSNDINPYEGIQLGIKIDNPDQFMIISVLTDEGTFVVNQVIEG